jgi:hypothetical protein
MQDPGFGFGDAVPQSSGPEVNPNHAGPWKLQTNFGLTYEFPDTKGLKSWLSNRDELDGFTLSADGENFLPLDSFPQLKASPASLRRSGQFAAQSGLHANPLAAGPAQPAPAQTGPSASGLIESPFSTASGQAAFQERAPLPPPPAAATGPKIDTSTYRPPSRDDKWNVVIWALAGILLVVAAALVAEVTGVYPVKELLFGAEKSAPMVAPQQPIATSGQQEADDEEVETEAQRRARLREQVDRILDDAEVDMASNRITSAIERLNTARTLEPQRVRVYERLAEAHEKLGQNEQAEAMRETAQELRDQEAAASEQAGAAD